MYCLRVGFKRAKWTDSETAAPVFTSQEHTWICIYTISILKYYIYISLLISFKGGVIERGGVSNSDAGPHCTDSQLISRLISLCQSEDSVYLYIVYCLKYKSRAQSCTWRLMSWCSCVTSLYWWLFEFPVCWIKRQIMNMSWVECEMIESVLSLITLIDLSLL